MSQRTNQFTWLEHALSIDLFGIFQISTPEAQRQNGVYRAIIHPPSGIREYRACPGHGPKEMLVKPAENSVRCLTITWP
jgi:hypothetical protein